MADGQSAVVWISRRNQAARFQVSVRTVERWGQRPELAMPPEFEFNGRFYRRLEDLERWENARPARLASRTTV
jgi:hypothetical protein